MSNARKEENRSIKFKKQATYKTLPKLLKLKETDRTSKLIGGQVFPGWGHHG